MGQLYQRAVTPSNGYAIVTVRGDLDAQTAKVLELAGLSQAQQTDALTAPPAAERGR